MTLTVRGATIWRPLTNYAVGLCGAVSQFSYAYIQLPIECVLLGLGQPKVCRLCIDNINPIVSFHLLNVRRTGHRFSALPPRPTPCVNSVIRSGIKQPDISLSATVGM